MSVDTAPTHGRCHQQSGIRRERRAITIQGYPSTYYISGHCASLTVSAYGNEVLVDSADIIDVSSHDNSVAHRSSLPKVTDTGTQNIIGPLG
jgi:hypothetical protein